VGTERLGVADERVERRREGPGDVVGEPGPGEVTVTGPVSSRYVESTTPPATIPIEPTP
jgi:hypothetical protein